MKTATSILCALLLPLVFCSAVFINSYRFASAGGATDPYFASVVLLLHCDGSNGSTTFPDSSSSAKTMLVSADAQVDTGQKKYGTGSLKLDASGDYLRTNSSSADFSFSTATDFTVEAWVYVQAASPNTVNWFALTARKYYFGTYSGAVVVGGSGWANLFLGTTSFTPYLDKWTHVAHTRSGSTHRLFVDGVLKETASNSGSVGDTDTASIGNDPNFGPVFNGWIDEVRVTKGVCRYTADFIPPPAAFPDS